MNDMPLLLRACVGGEFGAVREYTSGAVYEAGFIYLAGEPDAEVCASLNERYHYRMLVCLSDAWERALISAYGALCVTERYEMRPERGLARAARVPEGYQIQAFDSAAYALKPFGHGANYANWADFEARGAGALARIDGEIACSAASFLSYRGEAEMDVFTQIAHRRKGLAHACAAEALNQCDKRGLTARWDAQNAASKALAEALGYRVNRVYRAYSFVKPEIP